MGFEARATINCTPDLVWAVMTDWSKAPYWLGVDGLKPQLKQAKIGKGTVLTYNARGSQTSTITRWEPEAALTLESVQAGVTAVYRYKLTQEGATTRVELRADCSATAPVWRFLLPLIQFMMSRADRKQVDALKTLTETMVAAAERKADQLSKS